METSTHEESHATVSGYTAHLALFDAPFASTGITLTRPLSFTESGAGTPTGDIPIKLFLFSQDGVLHRSLNVYPACEGFITLPLTSIATGLPAQFGIRLAQVVAFSSAPFVMRAYITQDDVLHAELGGLLKVRRGRPGFIPLCWGGTREQGLLVANIREKPTSFQLTFESRRSRYEYEGWLSGLGTAFWSPELTIHEDERTVPSEVFLRVSVREPEDLLGVQLIEWSAPTSGSPTLSSISW